MVCGRRQGSVRSRKRVARASVAVVRWQPMGSATVRVFGIMVCVWLYVGAYKIVKPRLGHSSLYI